MRLTSNVICHEKPCRGSAYARIKMHGIRFQHGFSLFELIIAAVALAVLAGFLLNRLSYYEEVAEKAHAELTISQIKSLLRLRIANLMVEGRLREAKDLAGQNPMEWLDAKPDNYLGSHSNIDARRYKGGNWYFENSSGTLIYLVKNSSHFVSADGFRGIRIQVKPVRNTVDAFGSTTTHILETAKLEIVTTYKWFE